MFCRTRSKLTIETTWPRSSSWSPGWLLFRKSRYSRPCLQVQKFQLKGSNTFRFGPLTN